ncbi:hypothetical protein GC387_01270 [Pseudomonas sp. MWU12-2323]|nr:hypothetical protein [Pseudomonas sp. MWU12-2323]
MRGWITVVEQIAGARSHKRRTRFCGSRLAGDDVRIDGARLAGLIAGKPAPTRVVFQPAFT